MGVGGNDLLDVVVDHGCGMDGVPRRDGWICFHQLQGSIGLSEGYRKYRKAEMNHRGVADLGNVRLSEGKITMENFLEDFRIGDGTNVPQFDFLQDILAWFFTGMRRPQGIHNDIGVEEEGGIHRQEYFRAKYSASHSW